MTLSLPLKMKSFFAACLFLLLSIVAFAADPEAAQTAPGNILEDDWQLVSLSGAPIGYVHTITYKTDDPQPQIVTSIFSETQLRRLGQKISMHSNSEHRETLDGALVSAKSETSGAGGSSTTNATVTPERDKIAIATTVAGKVQSRVIDMKQDVIGPYAQAQRLRAAEMKQATEVRYSAFLPELQRIAFSTFKLEEQETLTIDGKEMLLRRGGLEQDVLPGIKMKVWLDDDGNVVRSTMNILGEIETLRVPKEKALAAISPDGAAEVMMSFMVPADVVIDAPSKVSEAVYQLNFPDAVPPLQFEDRRQAIVESGKDYVKLRVSALQDGAEPQPTPAAEFSAPAPYIQSDDPGIKAIAEQATAGANTPVEKALRLKEWVYRNMAKKNYSVGFASAKEVALTREGDCTEHAVLLAALLRASGIPSRLAVGVTYWNGAFAYHMWTEAFLNDWTALDPTMKYDYVDATHIRLASTSLATSTPAEPLIGLVPVIGKLKIHIVETHAN